MRKGLVGNILDRIQWRGYLVCASTNDRIIRSWSTTRHSFQHRKRKLARRQRTLECSQCGAHRNQQNNQERNDEKHRLSLRIIFSIFSSLLRNLDSNYTNNQHDLQFRCIKNSRDIRSFIAMISDPSIDQRPIHWSTSHFCYIFLFTLTIYVSRQLICVVSIFSLFA